MGSPRGAAQTSRLMSFAEAFGSLPPLSSDISSGSAVAEQHSVWHHCPPQLEPLPLTHAFLQLPSVASTDAEPCVGLQLVPLPVAPCTGITDDGLSAGLVAPVNPGLPQHLESLAALCDTEDLPAPARKRTRRPLNVFTQGLSLSTPQHAAVCLDFLRSSFQSAGSPAVLASRGLRVLAGGSRKLCISARRFLVFATSICESLRFLPQQSAHGLGPPRTHSGKGEARCATVICSVFKFGSCLGFTTATLRGSSPAGT